MNFRCLSRLLCLVSLFYLSGCGSVASLVAAAPVQAPTLVPTATEALIATPFFPNTPVPTTTALPIPSVTPTPALVFQQGKITCPILLYHHIDNPPNPKTPGARYYVTPENFAEQMKTLHTWGYQTIPISLLVEAIKNGAPLPERPIVISFDDGYESVYKNAYPVMQQYGFSGVNYIVADRLQAEGFMHPDQLLDLAAHGWEVGVHGMSHIDLTLNHNVLDREIAEARVTLEGTLGVQAPTFAYPFATYDDEVVNAVEKAGFTAAMGVGNPYQHGMKNLYYLSRIEIRYDYDVDKMASILPWSQPLQLQP